MDLCGPCRRIRFKAPFSVIRPRLYPQYSLEDSVYPATPDDGPDYEEHHCDFAEMESCANQPNGCNLCKVFMWCCRKKGEGNGNHSLCTRTFSLDVDDFYSDNMEALSDRLPQNRTMGFSGFSLPQRRQSRTTGRLEIFLLNPASQDKDYRSMETLNHLPPNFGIRYFFLEKRLNERRPMNWFVRALISPQDSTDTASVSETNETNFGDTVHIDRARNWISECLKDHTTCKQISRQQKHLPARVLNVARSESLVFLETNEDKLGNYVALSYCWGQAKQVKLEGVDPLSKFGEGISVSTLPKTIQDAMSVTRRLGFDYLWVDALCIIQDSKEDLNREKARMDIVYSSATVTLFVTSGLSADDGIFSRDHPPWTCSISVPWAQVEGDTMKTFNVRAQVSDEEERDGLGYPWNSRGWTMQEYMSAPRGIIYTDSQMSWFCLTHAKKGNADWIDQEDDRTRILDAMASTTVLNDKFEQISHFWRALMRFADLGSSAMSRKDLQDSITHQFYAIPNELNNRRFTYESDKLEAVASIAKTTEQKLYLLRCAEIQEADPWKKRRTTNSAQYWAGLWDDDWAYGFFWKKERENLWSKNPKQVLTRPEGEPCVPSWSWASVLYSRHQSFSEFMKSAPTSHIRNVITPELTNNQERFVPTRPLPLRLTAPLLRLSEDWSIPNFLSEESYNVSTGFEARLRELFHISWDWTSFLQGESKLEWGKKRKRSLSSNGEQQYVIIQVLSWEVAPLYYEEAFYLILEHLPQPQSPGDTSVTPETPERYRRIASLSQRGVLTVKGADAKLKTEFETWRDEQLKRAKVRELSNHLDRNKFMPIERELIYPSLLELARRDPWPEIEIELV